MLLHVAVGALDWRQPSRADSVGAQNSITSCDLGIFMDQPPEGGVALCEAVAA